MIIGENILILVYVISDDISTSIIFWGSQFKIYIPTETPSDNNKNIPISTYVSTIPKI